MFAQEQSCKPRGSSYRSHFYAFVILFRFYIAFTFLMHAFHSIYLLLHVLFRFTEINMDGHGPSNAWKTVILILDLSHEWNFSMNLISSHWDHKLFVANCNNRYQGKKDAKRLRALYIKYCQSVPSPVQNQITAHIECVRMLSSL